MNHSKGKNSLAYIGELLANKDIDEALVLINELEAERILYPWLLVLKYLCMVTSETSDVTLSDLENLLNQALGLDSNYLPAIVELAHFKMNILDKPGEAIQLFERASEIMRQNATEITLGHAQCIAELKSSKAAIDFIELQQKQLIDSEKLQEFLGMVDIYSSS